MCMHFGPHWSHGAVLDLRGHLQGVMEEQCGGRVDCSGQSPAAAGKDSSLETSVMCVCGGGRKRERDTIHVHTCIILV